MKLRISAGKYKNKRLKVASSTMPVRERVKLAVFSILKGKVVGAKCLDLFAGSGNLGFEALSRDAKFCTFVEFNKQAISLLLTNKENILGADDEKSAKIIRADAVKYVMTVGENYDIIFADPPYDTKPRHILKNIDDILEDGGIIIFFHHKKDEYKISSLNENLKRVDTRTYGITQVDFIVRKS